MVGVADQRVGIVLVQAVAVRIEATPLPVQMADDHGPHLPGELEVARPQKVPHELVGVDLLHVVGAAGVLRRMDGYVAPAVQDRIGRLPSQVALGVGVRL